MTQRTIRTCSVENCENKHLARGLCKNHYEKQRRLNAAGGIKKVFTCPEESFAARTKLQGDCLIWTGHIIPNGYGRLSAYGVQVYAHRYAWERVHGPIPDGVNIDHICHNKACCNIEHLRQATVAQNTSYRSGPQSNNTSGHRNVTYEKRTGRWVVQLVKQGESFYYGSYTTVEEATVVAEKARKDLFGDYAGRG